MTLSPMDRAKTNRWSEKIAQEIASRCLRWTENGALLDIQRAAAIVRAGVTEREQNQMTDVKPTPWTAGPWKAGQPFSPPETNEREIGIQSPMQMIGYVHGGYIGDNDEQEMMANAKLIAAAPELADCLRTLHDLQNGAPLIKYAEEWADCMERTIQLLKRIGK